MNILEYADILNLDLKITYHHNQDGRFSADLERVEVMRDGGLSGVYGNGPTPAAAILDYAKRLQGKRIAVNAYTNQRREYSVPANLDGLP